MTEIKTWQQAVDYTFTTRHSWRHGNGAKTARFNTNHFTRLRGSSFPINKITQPIMSQVSIELEDEGKSDATINRVVSAVSTVLNHLAFDGILDNTPKFRRRKENEHRVKFYTKDEVEHLITLSTEVFQREDLAEIIAVASYTGMRQAELLKLRKKDIDFYSNRILVGGEQAVTTKASNYRAIPIHDKILAILVSRCSQSERDNLRIFGDEWRDKDQLLRAFKKVNKALGKDEDYVFHTLRHSYATWHAEAGTPIRTLMTLLGHKRIETTLRYAKTTDKALDEAMNNI